MAIRYEVLEDSQLVRIHIAGSPTSQDMLDLLDQVLSDSRLRTGFAVLSDQRDIDQPATPDQIKAIVARVAAHTNERSPSRITPYEADDPTRLANGWQARDGNRSARRSARGRFPAL